MRELLVRYLMGELDDPELRHLEGLLRTSPELRAELAHLRTCLNAADDLPDNMTEPPRGLAERTADLVNEYSSEPTESCRSIANFGHARVAAFAADVDPPTGSLSWNFADFVVAAGVCLAVGMLLLPALSDSREAVFRRGCQNNLRTWGQIFALNLDRNDGNLVPIRQSGNVNTYVVRFSNMDSEDSQLLSKIANCPGKTKQTQTIQNPQVLPVNSLAILDRKPQNAPYVVHDYVFDIGYRDERGHHSRRNTHSPYVPVVADAPSPYLKGQLSLNHPGIIQILFQDGHVKIARTYFLTGAEQDHLFENKEGRSEAGCNPLDIVLGPAQFLPIADAVTP